jgi:thiol-disulfide isomerase/thioredoxin
MSTIDVVYVTAERCHFCDRGRTVLAELAQRYPLRIREVALTSEEGRELAARWRVPYPPIVLIGGRLTGYGRLSAKALERTVVSAAVAGVTA